MQRPVSSNVPSTDALGRFAGVLVWTSVFAIVAGGFLISYSLLQMAKSISDDKNAVNPDRAKSIT